MPDKTNARFEAARRIGAGFGAAALSITHDIASARRIAIRIAMIFDGRIIWSGAVNEIDDCVKARVENIFNGRAEAPNQMQVRRL